MGSERQWNSGEYTRYLYAMPYLNDPRRTVTINLHPDEYAALAEDALTAGYETPGTYAKALVRARGDAPEPILDRRSAERVLKLQGANEWLLQQLDAAHAQLQQAGLPIKSMRGPGGEPAPRSWAAQQRAVDQAVALALEQERAQVAKRLATQARRAAIKAGTQP
jgi:hypothetical protein